MQQQTTNKPSGKANKENRSNSSYLMQYAGLAFQLIAGLGLGVLAGIKADDWIDMSFPLFIWLMPLIILLAMFVKIFKDTSPRK
jgi:F0F1-type ATP synthase assembly protein I